MPLRSTTQASNSDPKTSTLTPSTFTDGHPLPKLLIFDLDYTLWPYWVDTHVSPPLRPHSSSSTSAAKDRSGATFSFYPEVPSVLAAAAAHNIPVAAASRTHTPDIALAMLDILHIETADGSPKRKRSRDFFADLQIYPSNKTKHMRELKRITGTEFEDMLFFDDEARNRNVETELGVAFVMVRDGVNRRLVDEGVRSWRKRRGHRGA